MQTNRGKKSFIYLFIFFYLFFKIREKEKIKNKKQVDVVNADVAQQKHSNNKYYALPFIYIYIYELVLR